MHSHQIWTFYACRFKILQFKVNNFPLQYCHFASIVTEDRLLESWLEFTWKAANFTALTLYYVLTITLPKTLTESCWHAVTFWNFVFSWLARLNFKGEKAFLRWNLNCHILGTEGRRKLKFGKVSFQICQNFSEKIKQKNFWPDCSFESNFITTNSWKFEVAKVTETFPIWRFP